MQEFIEGQFFVDPQKIICSKQQKVNLLCANKNCQKCALICSKQACQCNSQNQHSSCFLVLSSKLIKSLQQKRGVVPPQIQKAFEAIDNMYLNAIEALSEDREKMNIMRNNYGLNEYEAKVLHYLFDRRTDKLTGDLIARVKQNQSSKKSQLQFTQESVQFFWEKEKKYFNTLLAKMRNVIHQNKLSLDFQELKKSIVLDSQGKITDPEVEKQAIQMYYKLKKNGVALAFQQFNKRIKIWWDNLRNDKSDVTSYLELIIPEVDGLIQDLKKMEQNQLYNPEGFCKKLGLDQSKVYEAQRRFSIFISQQQLYGISSEVGEHNFFKTNQDFIKQAHEFVTHLTRFWNEKGGQLTQKIYSALKKNNKKLANKLKKNLIHPQHSAIFLGAILSVKEDFDFASILRNLYLILVSAMFRVQQISLNKIFEPLCKRIWYDDDDQ